MRCPSVRHASAYCQAVYCVLRHNDDGYAFPEKLTHMSRQSVIKPLPGVGHPPPPPRVVRNRPERVPWSSALLCGALKIGFSSGFLLSSRQGRFEVPARRPLWAPRSEQDAQLILYISIYLSIYIYIYGSIYIYIHPSIHPSIHTYIHKRVYLYMQLGSFYQCCCLVLFLHLHVYLRLCIFQQESVYTSINII